VSLSFLAAVLFGFHGGLQAPKNIPAERGISAVPAEIQPGLVSSCGKLPLGFEVNQGQTDARVRFLAGGGGYTILLIRRVAVLALGKRGARSQKPDEPVKQTRPNKFEAFSGFFRPNEVVFKRNSVAPRTARTLNSQGTTAALLRLRPSGGKSKAKITVSGPTRPVCPAPCPAYTKGDTSGQGQSRRWLHVQFA
jgi:hypothetical protein